jgi:hypothetical protein
LIDEHIEWMEVAVDPNWFIVVLRGCQGALPQTGHDIPVVAIEERETLPQRCVTDAQRCPPMRVARVVGGSGAMECEEERRQQPRAGDVIYAPCHRSRCAFEIWNYQPWPGIALIGSPDMLGYRHRQRQRGTKHP